MPNKFKTTKRKFYNKWTHKISLMVAQGWRLRSLYELSEDLVEINTFLAEFDKDSYATRLESSIVDIYTNDQDMFDSMTLKFNKLLRAAWRPDNDMLSSLGEHEIIAKSYPHGKFQFKVYLAPHNLDDEQKTRFLKWLESQPEDNYLISNAVKNWFIKMAYNYDRRYIYVADEKNLIMLKLKMADALGTVYRYVLT